MNGRYPKMRPLKIFAVENHTDTLLALCQYLESLGHEVSTARSLAEALDKISEDLDLLISDIGLPDGTGWDLLQKAKLRPNVFAVAMSGFGTAADIAQSYQIGFRRHLLKPFQAMELDKILEEAVWEIGVK